MSQILFSKSIVVPYVCNVPDYVGCHRGEKHSGQTKESASNTNNSCITANSVSKNAPEMKADDMPMRSMINVEGESKEVLPNKIFINSVHYQSAEKGETKTQRQEHMELTKT